MSYICNMKQEINPQETSRAEAFRLWMSSPMPMVTLTKTFDVTPIYKMSQRTDMKFNMLLCWCIGKAAKDIKEFYLLPEGTTLYQYDRLAINVIVENCKGGINSCDIPFSDDVNKFYCDYLTLTAQTASECKSRWLEDHMIIGTSAMIQTELDSIVNQYSGTFNNPFLAWGRYRKEQFKTKLPISFQFHPVQMDGGQAALFLERLQQEMNELRNQ